MNFPIKIICFGTHSDTGMFKGFFQTIRSLLWWVMYSDEVTKNKSKLDVAKILIWIEIQDVINYLTKVHIDGLIFEIKMVEDESKEATKTSSTLALMIMMRWILRLYRTEGSKEVLAKNGLEFWIFKIQFCNQFGQSKEEKGILRNLGQEEIIPYHMGQFMDLAQMEHNRATLWSRDRPNLHATIRTLVSLETFGVELLSFYYMCLLWSLCVIRINSQLNLCLYWLCY